MQWAAGLLRQYAAAPSLRLSPLRAVTLGSWLIAEFVKNFLTLVSLNKVVVNFSYKFTTCYFR